MTKVVTKSVAGNCRRMLLQAHAVDIIAAAAVVSGSTVVTIGHAGVSGAVGGVVVGSEVVGGGGVGAGSVGSAMGFVVGLAVGSLDGMAVGVAVGFAVGLVVGLAVGGAVGGAVGNAVGAAVGSHTAWLRGRGVGGGPQLYRSTLARAARHGHLCGGQRYARVVQRERGERVEEAGGRGGRIITVKSNGD